MAPYKALYGRKCRSSVCWTKVGERQLFEPKKVQITIEKIQLIQKRLQLAQSHYKIFADTSRRLLEFEVGEYVFLKVSPSKGITRFGKRGKLNPRYVGLYEIVERIGPLAYRLELPQVMANVHDVFQVSMLWRCVTDGIFIPEPKPLQIREDLTYLEHPVQILDRKDQVLRNKMISLVMVLWRNHSVEEATWEQEDEIREKCPHLF